MKKSEKILLSVLGVVSLWAGYILLFDDAPTVQETAVVEGQEEAKVATFQTAIDGIALSEAELYTLSVAGRPMERSPFYANASQFYFTGMETVGDGDNEGLVYNGYLAVGNQVLAIINGIEYAAGDDLAFGGYRLLNISRGYVLVERRDSETGRVSKRQVALAEDNVDDVTLKAVY